MNIAKVWYPESIRNLNKFTSKNNPTKKWAKDMNKQFSKEDVLATNKYMRKAQYY